MSTDQLCVCRKCKIVYKEEESTADILGYCSEKCMKAKGKGFGWRPKKWPPLFMTLRDNKAIGLVRANAKHQQQG